MRRSAKRCEGTEVSYRDFRTGLTYRDVYQMLWSYSPDPHEWRYKRRGTVLGKWHQIKREMFDEYQRRLYQARNKETTNDYSRDNDV